MRLPTRFPLARLRTTASSDTPSSPTGLTGSFAHSKPSPHAFHLSAAPPIVGGFGDELPADDGAIELGSVRAEALVEALGEALDVVGVRSVGALAAGLAR